MATKPYHEDPVPFDGEEEDEAIARLIERLERDEAKRKQRQQPQGDNDD